MDRKYESQKGAEVGRGIKRKWKIRKEREKGEERIFISKRERKAPRIEKECRSNEK